MVTATTFARLQVIVRTYPEELENLYQQFVSHPTFYYWVNNLNTFSQICMVFPAHKHLLFKRFIDDDVLPFFINGAQDVRWFCEFLPEDKEEIYRHTLGNDERFYYYVSDYFDSALACMDLFADKKAELFLKLKEEKASCNRFLLSNLARTKEYIKLFPEFKQEMITQTLGNRNWFIFNLGRFWSEATQLAYHKFWHQGYKGLAFEFMLQSKNLPFFINSLNDLERAAKFFKDQRETLFNLTLANPILFEYFISNLTEFKWAQEIFPEQVLWKNIAADSIEEIKKRMLAYVELEASCEMIKIYRERWPQTLFAQLPREVQANVASFTTEADGFNEKEKSNIAYQLLP
jgi:hypothetical protein